MQGIVSAFVMLYMHIQISVPKGMSRTLCVLVCLYLLFILSIEMLSKPMQLSHLHICKQFQDCKLCNMRSSCTGCVLLFYKDSFMTLIISNSI